MTNSDNDSRPESTDGATSTGPPAQNDLKARRIVGRKKASGPRVIVGSFDVNDRDSYSPGEVTPLRPIGLCSSSPPWASSQLRSMPSWGGSKPRTLWRR